MGNNYHFGDKIKDIVQEAQDTNDYSRLYEKISRAIGDDLKNASAGRAEYERRKAYMNSQSPGGAARGGYVKPLRSGTASGTAGSAASRNAQNAEYNKLFKTPPEDTKGKLEVIFGALGTVVFGMAAIWNAIISVLASSAASAAGAVVTGVLAAVCAGLIAAGIKNLNFVSRFKNYCKEVFKKKFIDIRELARKIGKSENVVRKDVKKLIDSGSFKEGHLDETESTLIITDELYDQYMTTKRRSDELKAEEERRRAENPGLSDDVEKVLKTGNEYILKIQKANAELPDAEMTSKLTRLELIISRIFARVEERPREARRLDQFMDYYLPTTWKLISAYQEMESQDIQGDTIQSAKREILDSLDSINDAYEKLLDSLFQDKALDVSTDISVMQSMMKQDGLTDDDFSFEETPYMESFSEGLGGVQVQEASEEME